MQFADDQAASRLVFDDGRVLTKCDRCRQLYAERTPPGEPPCDACKVVLKEENEEAATVYMICRNQYITAGPENQVMDLSIPAVKTVMDMHGVKNQKECFEKVMRIFHYFNAKRNQDHAGE